MVSIYTIIAVFVAIRFNRVLINVHVTCCTKSLSHIKLGNDYLDPKCSICETPTEMNGLFVCTAGSDGGNPTRQRCFFTFFFVLVLEIE